MRGRGRAKGGVISTDLLACFPSRGHLALLPKPVSSPARAAGDVPKTRQLLPGPLSRLSGAGRGVGGLVGNPRLLRSRTARRKALPAPPSASTELVSEPSSPKVTCAGQIKVGRQCSRRQQVKGSGRQARWRRPSWMGALGIKREVLHLLAGAVRGLRLNSGCFGRNIPCNVDCTSDDEEEEEKEEVEQADRRAGMKGEKEEEAQAATASGDALSRWFTTLEVSKTKTVPFPAAEEEDDGETELAKSLEPGVPPPNALLLMRCRSAPTRGRFRDVDEDEEDDDDIEHRTETTAAAPLVITKGVGETTSIEAAGCDSELEKVVLRPYAPDVFKVLSMEVAQETWVAGTGGPDGPDPLLLRCRSWRR